MKELKEAIESAIQKALYGNQNNLTEFKVEVTGWEDYSTDEAFNVKPVFSITIKTEPKK